MKRIAIIADDLTGALDTASPFACRGARTFCFAEPDAINLNAAQDAQVISVSTNSRHMPPECAAAAVRAAVEGVRAFLPDIVLKKVDSRLKGNVTAECEVVALAFGYGRLLVVPAAPDIGRRVIDGAVEGAGVAQPIPVAPLFASSGIRFDCPDVPSPVAMHDIAKLFLQKQDALPVCSRGFAVALAGCLFPDGAAEYTILKRPWLVAIGSRDPVTTAQRVALCKETRFVCQEAPDGNVETHLPAAPALLLHCSGTQRQTAEEVAIRFAEGVKRAMATLEPCTLLCSGGDTARAILQTLGQTQLDVLGEVAPGLPVSRIKLLGHDVIFITKSGGFGEPSTLLDVFSDQPGTLRPKEQDGDGPQH